MMPSRRAGFSLWELLLATTILLGSAIVLAELAAIGHLHADGAEQRTSAQWICQTKVNEMLCGATPIERVERRALPDQPGWVYSVQIQPVSQSGFGKTLFALQVTVEEGVEGPASKEEQLKSQRGERFTLTRWIHDPTLARLTIGGGDSFLADDALGPSESPLDEQSLEDFFEELSP